MKFAFAFFSGFFILVSASFAFPFNLKLSEQELDSALNGEILIRNISSYKNICLDVENAEIKDRKSVV